MKYKIHLKHNPGISRGHLVWYPEGKEEKLDLSTGPYMIRIDGDFLLLQSEASLDYSLESLGLKCYTFLWDETLYGLDEGQTQMWFGSHPLPDPKKEVLGFHAIGTGDLADTFPNKVEISRQIAVNLDYDGAVFQASISSSNEVQYGVLLRQSSELFHGIRRVPKPIPGIYQPHNNN